MPEPRPDLNTLCDGDPLARALAALRPVPPAGLDAPRLVYLAGRAERDRAAAFWRRAFAAQSVCVVLAAAVTGVYLAHDAERGPAQPAARRSPAPPPAGAPVPAPQEASGPEPAPAPRIILPPESPPTQPLEGFAGRTDEPTVEERAKWLHLRNDVLAAGLGVLPTPPPAAPPTAPDWERSFGVSPKVLGIHPPRPARGEE
ncbi:hypothetical protein [Fimbriiglobus ruber]|uniref:Uncharacterized protein n=1 Tax=Fimbriiglobus ruber TaxID=1908690 RepID=A0A225E1S5_9BACT|nr:hypothetical protein [Fimbriiglobus ruber]OWK45734.1 hypothetical protein FRUB_02065 [Fimbriiglobus ruber]